MIYERVWYKCPKCNKMKFFNKAEEYSTICPECNIGMQNMGSDFVDSEVERKKTEDLQRRIQQARENPVICPYCGSGLLSKISTTAKVVNTAIFGIFGTKRHKQWHCNECKSDF